MFRGCKYAKSGHLNGNEIGLAGSKIDEPYSNRLHSDTTELDCDKQQEAISIGTMISHAQNRTLENNVVLIAVLLRDY